MTEVRGQRTEGKRNRVACVVPFCGRTRAPDGSGEWICPLHWRLVATTLKRRRRRCIRLIQRAIDKDRVDVSALLLRSWDRIWADCKAQAIERAAGIG